MRSSGASSGIMCCEIWARLSVVVVLLSVVASGQYHHGPPVPNGRDEMASSETDVKIQYQLPEGSYAILHLPGNPSAFSHHGKDAASHPAIQPHEVHGGGGPPPAQKEQHRPPREHFGPPAAPEQHHRPAFTFDHHQRPEEEPRPFVHHQHQPHRQHHQPPPHQPHHEPPPPSHFQEPEQPFHQEPPQIHHQDFSQPQHHFQEEPPKRVKVVRKKKKFFEDDDKTDRPPVHINLGSGFQALHKPTPHQPDPPQNHHFNFNAPQNHDEGHHHGGGGGGHHGHHHNQERHQNQGHHHGGGAHHQNHEHNHNQGHDHGGHHNEVHQVHSPPNFHQPQREPEGHGHGGGHHNEVHQVHSPPNFNQPEREPEENHHKPLSFSFPPPPPRHQPEQQSFNHGQHFGPHHQERPQETPQSFSHGHHLGHRPEVQQQEQQQQQQQSFSHGNNFGGGSQAHEPAEAPESFSHGHHLGHQAHQPPREEQQHFGQGQPQAPVHQTFSTGTHLSHAPEQAEEEDKPPRPFVHLGQANEQQRRPPPSFGNFDRPPAHQQEPPRFPHRQQRPQTPPQNQHETFSTGTHLVGHSPPPPEREEEKVQPFNHGQHHFGQAPQAPQHANAPFSHHQGHEPEQESQSHQSFNPHQARRPLAHHQQEQAPPQHGNHQSFSFTPPRTQPKPDRPPPRGHNENNVQSSFQPFKPSPPAGGGASGPGGFTNFPVRGPNHNPFRHQTGTHGQHQAEQKKPLGIPGFQFSPFQPQQQHHHRPEETIGIELPPEDSIHQTFRHPSSVVLPPVRNTPRTPVFHTESHAHDFSSNFPDRPRPPRSHMKHSRPEATEQGFTNFEAPSASAFSFQNEIENNIGQSFRDGQQAFQGQFEKLAQNPIEESEPPHRPYGGNYERPKRHRYQDERKRGVTSIPPLSAPPLPLPPPKIHKNFRPTFTPSHEDGFALVELPAPALGPPRNTRGHLGGQVIGPPRRFKRPRRPSKHGEDLISRESQEVEDDTSKNPNFDFDYWFTSDEEAKSPGRQQRKNNFRPKKKRRPHTSSAGIRPGMSDEDQLKTLLAQAEREEGFIYGRKPQEPSFRKKRFKPKPNGAYKKYKGYYKRKPQKKRPDEMTSHIVLLPDHLREEEEDNSIEVGGDEEIYIPEEDDEEEDDYSVEVEELIARKSDIELPYEGETDKLEYEGRSGNSGIELPFESREGESGIELPFESREAAISMELPFESREGISELDLPFESREGLELTNEIDTSVLCAKEEHLPALSGQYGHCHDKLRSCEAGGDGREAESDMAEYGKCLVNNYPTVKNVSITGHDPKKELPFASDVDCTNFVQVFFEDCSVFIPSCELLREEPQKALPVLGCLFMRYADMMLPLLDKDKRSAEGDEDGATRLWEIGSQGLIGMIKAGGERGARPAKEKV